MTMPRRAVSRLIARAAGLAAVAAVAALTAVPAQAADPRVLNTFGDWTAYVSKESSGKVCFMVSQPKKAEGDYTQRGDIFAFITHRPGEKRLNEVQIIAGYPYKEKSEATLRVDRQEWKLFTNGEHAWAYDAKSDAAIADAVRKGSSMVVKGVSARGTETTDTYSLTGSNAAYEAIAKECGLKVE